MRAIMCPAGRGTARNVGASGSGSDSGAKTCAVTANTALTAGAVFSAISPSIGWLDWSGDIPVNHLLRSGRGDEVAHVSKEGGFSFPALAFSRRFSPPDRRLLLRRYFGEFHAGPLKEIRFFDAKSG